MLSGGKEWNWNGCVLVYMVGSHDKKYAYYDEEVRNSITSGDLSQDMKVEISKIETSQLLMAGLNYRHSDKLHLQYDLMMVHAAREVGGRLLGEWTPTFSLPIRMRALCAVSRLTITACWSIS